MTTLMPVTGTLPPGWNDYAGNLGDALSLATIGWLDGCGSKHTREAYQRDLLGLGRDWRPAPAKAPAWLPWCYGNEIAPLSALRIHVDAWGHLLEEAGYSRNTRKRKLCAVSSWYFYLISVDLTERNPVLAVSRKADPNQSRATALSEDEMNRLLDAARADGPRTEALVSLMYFGAFRVGSLLNATIGDLIWDQGDRALLLHLKGGSVRRKLLVGTAAQALDAYLATRPGAGAGEWLFTAAGQPLYRTYVWRLIRRLARNSEIESWRQLGPHSLRATHITHARDAGVALDIIQDAADHADGSTTLGYDNLRKERRRLSGTTLEARRLRYEAERGQS